MAILEIDRIVKFRPSMSGNTKLLFTDVRCVVKHAMRAGVQKYVDM